MPRADRTPIRDKSPSTSGYKMADMLISPIRPALGAVASAGLLMLVGGRNLGMTSFVRTAGAAAVALYVGDVYKARMGDGSMVAQAISTGVSGVAFAAINKLAFGANDSWTTLTVAGVLIDVVALFVENPVAAMLGL